MHVEVILPDLSDLMGGDLTTMKDIAVGAYDFTIPNVPEKRYQGDVASFTMM
ncbi:hypothetical protein IJL65_00250 [bacterium]|nr:hypothetical protein [bacterium]